MRRLALLAAAIGLVPVALAGWMWVDWLADCAGGRAAHPELDVNDCGDLQSALAILAPLGTLLIAPLALLEFARLLRLVRGQITDRQAPPDR